MIITRRIFNESKVTHPQQVTGPFRASDRLYDVYVDGYLHSRHQTLKGAQALVKCLRRS